MNIFSSTMLCEDIGHMVKCYRMTKATLKTFLVYMIELHSVLKLCFQTSGIDWRKKLDSQGGSVLATELKNNSCKLAKWTASAILAGSDYLKLG